MNPLLKKGLLTNFFEGFDGAEAQYEQIATKVPSNAASEDYGWLGSVPRLREMRGERVPQKLLAYSYTLKNKEFEASIEVKRADLKDDQTGKYGPLVKQIGESARLFPDELIFANLLPNGFTKLAYDGQYFFDTDHPVGNTGSTQSNKGTAALDATSYEAGRAALRRMKDDFGRPVNQKLDLILVVPAELEGTAKKLVEAETVNGGDTNTNAGTAKVLVSPWLVDTNNWYLVNVAGVIKPFVVQEREFIPFESLEEDSETGFWRKVHYYGTYWRGNAGYALYSKAYGALVA